MPASNPSFRPSRSTQRLAALRTRMSFQGEPSARENCQGQTCGSSLVSSTKPRCLISATASGAGASIQSTWPESNAAVRALASGIGSNSILSTLGTRALSQYFSFFTSSSRSRERGPRGLRFLLGIRALGRVIELLPFRRARHEQIGEIDRQEAVRLRGGQFH